MWETLQGVMIFTWGFGAVSAGFTYRFSRNWKATGIVFCVVAALTFLISMGVALGL